jgi:PilZ domain
MMSKERRKGPPRVEFNEPLEARAMTIDGTWSGDCLLVDISDTGARLKVTGHATKLPQFFLLLTCFGPPVFRHCKKVWVRAELMGVSFNKTNIGTTKSLEEVQHEMEPGVTE